MTSLDNRMKIYKKFLKVITPGLKNRIKIYPLRNPFGPHVHQDNADTFVLSN